MDDERQRLQTVRIVIETSLKRRCRQKYPQLNTDLFWFTDSELFVVRASETASERIEREVSVGNEWMGRLALG